MMKAMVQGKPSNMDYFHWDNNMERNASILSCETPPSMISDLPATRALELLNRQSKKRPRKSLESSSHVDLSGLFDAVSEDDPFPKIDWPGNEDQINVALGAKKEDSHSRFPISTKRSRIKLRRVSETKMWSTNSLPQSKRIVSGLSSLASTKKAKTELDFQQFGKNVALGEALSSYDQDIEARRIAASFKQIKPLDCGLTASF